MPNDNPGQRGTQSVVADDRQSSDRFARMEDLLCEMRLVQDLQIKKMKRLELLVERLAEPVARRRAAPSRRNSMPRPT